jgi:molybdenum cofactor biosynthesis enzyme MoaA
MACYDGAGFVVPESSDLIPLPRYSRLFTVPTCAPVGWSARDNAFHVFGKSDGEQAVSAFLPPGYLRLHHPAYETTDKHYALPLWAYAAAGYAQGRFLAAAMKIDGCVRWHPGRYDDRTMLPGIKKLKKMFPGNRLVGHLAHCAVRYHCFNAKNLFMGRWEAPLPVSRACNARCAGCISQQDDGAFPASHDRISFRPTVKEITELAVRHLETADDGIVSFGQGCEGEPLLEADLAARAVEEIRRHTGKGVIHMNTNGFSPERLKKLADAGLDSVRISLSSARKNLYQAYYRPLRYSFSDVLESLRTCVRLGLYTCVNYLVFPGITDEDAEWRCLETLIASARPHAIQLRNLNIDPHVYLERMRKAGAGRSLIVGIPEIVRRLRARFPGVRLGYFNRTRKEIGRHLRALNRSEKDSRGPA